MFNKVKGLLKTGQRMKKAMGLMNVFCEKCKPKVIQLSLKYQSNPKEAQKHIEQMLCDDCKQNLCQEYTEVLK